MPDAIVQLPAVPSQLITDADGHSAAVRLPTTSGEEWQIFDLTSKQLVSKLPGSVRSLGFSSDGLRMLYFNSDPAQFGIFSAERTGKNTQLLRTVSGYIYDVQWLANDTYALLLQDIPNSGTPAKTQYVAFAVSSKTFQPILAGDLPPLISGDLRTAIIGSSGQRSAPTLRALQVTADGPKLLETTIPSASIDNLAWLADNSGLQALTITDEKTSLETIPVLSGQPATQALPRDASDSFSNLIGSTNGFLYYIASGGLQRIAIGQ